MLQPLHSFILHAHMPSLVSPVQALVKAATTSDDFGAEPRGFVKYLNSQDQNEMADLLMQQTQVPGRDRKMQP